MSGRCWCFTLNNWDECELLYIDSALPCRYIIYGFEIGKEGTEHLQGYVEFANVKRLSAVKKYLGRAHWEIMQSTRENAAQYCKKDGAWCERGDWQAGGTGARNDLDRIRRLAADGNMRTVTSVGSYQQIKVAEKFLEYNEEPRDWKPEVIWIYGATGTGKSRRARELLNDGDIYTKNDGTKWWQGYDAHEDVIIDDFRSSWWSLTEMLSLIDRYEKRVETKGSSRQFRARRIVITSAMSPNDCYRGVGEDIGQLLRRIDRIEHL